ncbi:hypothetical protein RhiirA1_540455 [Rhizophagus irregularis]|uniref:Uncharacterized protein n=1 Tax=Rhizophagus irregularis TaxID=588596 RepID=A0A2N0R861_9GLOM|nr:hypothetical protein RhiirA1_540455 [Rhizophagus irregularis]
MDYTIKMIMIILNLSGLACSLSNIGLFHTINTTSLSEFWKLRQFRKSILDDYIVYGLILIRNHHHYHHCIRMTISPDVTLCDNDAHHGRCFLLKLKIV